MARDELSPSARIGGAGNLGTSDQPAPRGSVFVILAGFAAAAGVLMPWLAAGNADRSGLDRREGWVTLVSAAVLVVAGARMRVAAEGSDIRVLGRWAVLASFAAVVSAAVFLVRLAVSADLDALGPGVVVAACAGVVGLLGGVVAMVSAPRGTPQPFMSGSGLPAGATGGAMGTGMLPHATGRRSGSAQAWQLPSGRSAPAPQPAARQARTWSPRSFGAASGSIVRVAIFVVALAVWALLRASTQPSGPGTQPVPFPNYGTPEPSGTPEPAAPLPTNWAILKVRGDIGETVRLKTAVVLSEGKHATWTFCNHPAGCDGAPDLLRLEITGLEGRVIGEFKTSSELGLFIRLSLASGGPTWEFDAGPGECIVALVPGDTAKQVLATFECPSLKDGHTEIRVEGTFSVDLRRDGG